MDDSIRKNAPAEDATAPRASERAHARPRKDRSEPAAENSIRPRKMGTRANREARAAPTEHREEPAGASTSGNASSSAKPDSDPWTVPQSVRERFHQEGHRFYFPDGTPAFRDHGRKLTTPSENTEVIASLIEIARARGWAEITVTGTDGFRLESWRQARLSGLAVRGYRPNEGERVALKHALASRGEDREGEPGASLRGGNGAVAEPKDERSPDPAPRQDLIIGKLLAYGRENYRFDPREQMSYFVRLETQEGMRTIWGKDLERAIEKSLTKPQKGDRVALRTTGADHVTVRHRVRDAEGNLLKEADLATHRNRWVIERLEFFEARRAAAEVVRDPSIAPRVAVKSHPELLGTYLNLHAAELAAKRLRDPEDQKKFVSIVRGVLADAVARAEALEPVRLRARPKRSPPERLPPQPEAPTR